MSIETESSARNARRCEAAVRAVKQVTAKAFGVSLDELDAPTRSKAHIAFARQTAMYLANVVCSYSLTDVAQAFGRDRTTVSHACHLIEDRRDDDAFDQFLDRLEDEVSAALRVETDWREPARLETKSAMPYLLPGFASRAEIGARA